MPTSRFIQRFQDKITGVLSGFDRLVIRGSLLAIVTPAGMKNWLWRRQIGLPQFASWAQSWTEQLQQVSCQAAPGPEPADRLRPLRRHRQGCTGAPDCRQRRNYPGACGYPDMRRDVHGF